MGFGRYRLPPAYLARLEAANLPLPPGAHTMGRHTVCTELGWLEEYMGLGAGRSGTLDIDLPLLSHEEIRRHVDEENGIWIVVDDQVLDVTTFREVHPGGSSMFVQFAGKQCGWQYRTFHSADVLSKWGMLVVGRTKPMDNEYLQPKRINTA